MWHRYLNASLVCTLLLGGCAASGGSQSPNKTGTITQSEIDESCLIFATAHDVVRQLRPRWLIERGVSSFIPTGVSDTLLDFIAVYVDNQLLGDPESLRGVSPLLITDIRFLGYGRVTAPGISQPHSWRDRCQNKVAVRITRSLDD